MSLCFGYHTTLALKTAEVRYLNILFTYIYNTGRCAIYYSFLATHFYHEA